MNKTKNEIKTLQETIHTDYHLQREEEIWKLKDPPCVCLRAPDSNSIGFSLDDEDKRPLAFFSGNPPSDLSKMCDAIIAMAYENKLYLFIIEQKTRCKSGYTKQLTNGKYFCDWLMSLYKEYGYLSTDPIYIGMLVWQPRESSPRKGTTTHPDPDWLHRTRNFNVFNHCFEVRNKSEIPLIELVKSSRRKH